MPRLTVLTYHALDERLLPTAVSPAVFCATAARLAAAGASDAGPEDAVACADGRAAPSPLRTLVTFDDGYRSVVDAAAALLPLGFRPLLFLAPTLMGRPTLFPGDPLCPPQPALSWNEARELAAKGCRIGSHAFEHVDLRTLPDAALDDALRRSRGELESRLGAPCPTLAYPFGLHDARVRRAAAQVYDAAFGVRLDWVRPGDDRYALPRLDGWYLKGWARRGGPASAGSAAWIALRRLGRRVRSLVRGGPA
ncbi:MAG TPA: polysaccharide deacetylase family protein [Planctomycetota bacterium]|nr:polysaccharide deacetylase family protein [Planctomycetota bacterium]